MGGVECPRCESPRTRKAGLIRLVSSSKQRWSCKNCGYLFTEGSLGAPEGEVPKTASIDYKQQWLQYIESKGRAISTDHYETVRWWSELIESSKEAQFWYSRALEWYEDTIERRVV